MKAVFLMILFIFVNNAYSTVELSSSLYTYHWFDIHNAAAKYKNKENNNGRLISNPVYGMGFKFDNSERFHSLIKGQDSIGSQMMGYVNSPSNWYGFVFGAYSLNRDDWKKTNIEHHGTIKLNDKYSLIPILGIEISPKININENIYIKFRNIITPVITNHSLALGMDF